MGKLLKMVAVVAERVRGGGLLPERSRTGAAASGGNQPGPTGGRQAVHSMSRDACKR